VAAIINRNDAPSHLFNIPELDFSGDLFAERLGGPWFRLGAWTISRRRDERGVEDVVSRQSLLLASEYFAEVFDKLESIGNVIGNLGKPGSSVLYGGEEKEYKYTPFHRFEFPFASAVGEPLVFVHSSTSGIQLIINPDLWLFFELEEKTQGNGIWWWDPRRGVDALIQRVLDQGNLGVAEIRVDYLRKYLQARQMSLLVGHYRHLHLFDPSHSTIGAFVEEDVNLGSSEQGTKVIVQNWGFRQDIPSTPPFLQRRLHLWFEIRPQEIDVDDPWADQPSFDPYTFTLPTRVGPVAPARWKHFRHTEGRTFEGESCDFMSRVCFRQEVLTKYEGASGFDVGDNGSVSCQHYWGLVRSTARVGNELLTTAIGDFAEGVPFEEWPHWKQYAVEPPSPETAKALMQEQSVPDAVNFLVKALNTLNAAFAAMAVSFGVAIREPLWRGSLDSLAGRQLKWVYLATADDDEFLKRSTLVSTLVIESLVGASLRKLLSAMSRNLHMNDENPPRPLGSLKLLQRLTLIAVLIESFQPDIAGIPMLVRQAEGKAKHAGEPDLQAELEISHRRVRDECAPLAFLYDLRNSGGLPHAPNKAGAAAAAAQLGLPEENWHRTDYLGLLKRIAESVYQIIRHLDRATQVIMIRGAAPE
jgi:hypothetical protein